MLSMATRRYSDEERKELINNLKFEVTHRTTQLKRELEDRLHHFRINHESFISRLPKQVREMTMREFGEKYKGSIQTAVMGVHKAKFVSERGETALEKIDKDTRKRKWVESQETEDEAATTGSKKPKSARLAQQPSPKKVPVASGIRAKGMPGTPSRLGSLHRLPGSPSPQKIRPPFNSSVTLTPKGGNSHAKGGPTHQRLYSAPSLPKFNPNIPNNPFRSGLAHGSQLSDESLSRLSGSTVGNASESQPNPVNLSKGAIDENTASDRGLRRTKSTINIKRDPSYALKNLNNTHSRNNSHTKLFDSSSSLHSRTNSEATSATSTPPKANLPFARSYSVTISTKDGHLLEFDPLQTSPAALNALEGITDSAKKGAREEMARLMEAAVEKWRI